MVALGAIKGTGDYLSSLLLVHLKLQLPFTHGADQDLHRFSFHFRFPIIPF
jgi:hypothetical protein